MPLTSSSILVINISRLMFNCNDRRHAVTGCLQCRMTTPCGCSVTSPYGFIPTRLTGCSSANTNITTHHVTNLAVLQSFFDDTTLGALVGDTLLANPLPVDLPIFDIFKTNETTRLAKDSHLRYDLNRAINATKAEGVVFHTLAEKIWHDTSTFDIYDDAQSYTSWTHWTTPVQLIGFLVAFLSFLGVLFLLYRVKLLGATIATMQLTVHKVTAKNLSPTVPSYLSFLRPSNVAYVISTIPTPITYQTFTSSTISLDSILFIPCLILLVILLVKHFYRYQSNPNLYSLYLEIGNHSNTIQIECQKLPGTPNQYAFSATTFITNVEITGRFRKILHVTWSSLSIQNSYLNMDFDFNGHIPITVFQARRLREIIHSKFWCILTAGYNGCLYHIDIRNPDIEELLPREPPTLAITQSDGTVAINVTSDAPILLDATITDSSL